VRSWPADQRVGPLAFLPQALIMPVTYGLLTPLAVFTLDSATWETRGHEPIPPITRTSSASSAR
jgi:hypothetical protein